MGMPMTVAMGNAYYVFFMPMVIAMGMRMPTVMGMPMIMCTGTYTIGKHASRIVLGRVGRSFWVRSCLLITLIKCLKGEN